MELTEGLVFLANMPLLSIKLNMKDILSVLAIVSLVHVNSSLLYTYLERHAENVGSLFSLLTITYFHRFSKPTNFTLH